MDVTNIINYANSYKKHLKEVGPPKDQVIFILNQLAFYLQEQHGLVTTVSEPESNTYQLLINIDRGANVDQMKTLISCIEHMPHSYDKTNFKVTICTLSAALYLQGTINSIY